MNKLWILNPSPGGGCCGCAGKSSPCDGCCSGIFFQISGNPLNPNGDYILPSSEYDFRNCKVVSTIFDEYQTGAMQLYMNVGTTYTGTQNYINEISIQLKSGQNLSITSEAITDIANQNVNLFIVGNPPPPHTSCQIIVTQNNVWSARTEKFNFDSGIEVLSISEPGINVISGGNFIRFGQTQSDTGVMLPPLPATRGLTGAPEFCLGSNGAAVFPTTLPYIAGVATQNIGFAIATYVSDGVRWNLSGSFNFSNASCADTLAFIAENETCDFQVIGKWNQFEQPVFPPVGPIGANFTTNLPGTVNVQLFERQKYNNELSNSFTVSMRAKRDVCFSLTSQAVNNTIGLCNDTSFIEQKFTLTSDKSIPVTNIFFYTGQDITPKTRVKCPTA